MAEKEERIVFLKTKPKGECPCQIDKDYCKETCWVKGKCSLGITRQEAIERIATGYCGGICEKCTDGPNRSEHCIKWLEFRGTMEKAEAALNALLGE